MFVKGRSGARGPSYTLPASPLLVYAVSGDALGSLKVNLSTSRPLNDPLSVESAGRGPAAFPAILSDSI